MSQPPKIKVRVRKDVRWVGWSAVVIREIENPADRLVDREVLAQNGKWREKSPMDAIFDDEIFPVEEVM